MIKELPKSYDAKKVEPKWKQFWEDEKIYQFDQKSNSPIFSIDTPPPTVSGKIHIGHIFSYTQAEVIARYKRMKGFNVLYPFGFDDNGLPTEKLVEKELGIKGSDLDRKQFFEKCIGITNKYHKEFKTLWQSIGLSVDWNIKYSTISPFVQKISQKAFIDLFNSGKLDKKSSPALWCTECQTSIAQAEVEDKELDSVFYDIKFSLEDGAEIIIATTRPELLPACVAVFVHPEDEKHLHFIGKNIITPLQDKVPVLADDKVDPNKGTGIVMCCTYGDETDKFWVQKNNLPEKIIISKDGKIEGKNIREKRKEIVQQLEQENKIVSKQQIKHAVGTHERCGTPIEILPVSQWFIEILNNREKFLKIADQINWYPEYMKKRYIQWVENLKWDWCISRQRFFGIPIPVWYSKKTGEIILPDESQLPIDPQTDFPQTLPPNHTPDDIVPDYDVLDTWATSSLTPQINNALIENKDILPMSLRPQAHDIIRTWAFYTIVRSEYHNQNIPWKDIVISGHVLAAKGQKISKSKSNAKMEPEQLIELYSADAIRYWACGASLGKNIFFDEKEILTGKKFITKIWNATKFAIGNLQDFDPKKAIDESILTYTDQWILLRLKNLISKMNDCLDKYEFGLARIEFEKFFWHDFCDNYLEMVKSRIYEPQQYDNGDTKKLSAQYALYIVLLNILKLIAPYLPFITEELYQNYFAQFEGIKSIHKTMYPDTTIFASNQAAQILEGGDLFLELLQSARKFKTDSNIKLNQPLKKINILGNKQQIELLSEFKDDIMGATKAQEISFGESEKISFEFIPE